MRMPSSFHSTDARSKPAIASATLGAGRGEHRQDRAEELEPDRAEPLLPAVIAISAIRVRSPESISARRASSPGTPAALATASAITPASAPCLQLAGEQPPQERGLRLGGARRAARRAGPRAAAPSRGRWPLDLVDRAVDVVDGQRGVGGRAGSTP